MLRERRTVVVGAVQVESQPGETVANLQHATPFVEHAATQGAELVVLPELFSSGYVPNRAVWDAAEPAGGATARWLAGVAGRLGIYLGAGSVETDGSDFYNVFILAGPHGEIAGRAYKANAEADVFRRGRREHVIETDLGRIGIGICADNQFAAHLRLMREEQVDLVLMPHAWPTPARAAGLVSDADVRSQQERMVDLPRLYARLLGVPAVFVNQVGPLLPIGGILGRLMDPRIWRLRGQSRIVDADGAVLGQLSDEEAVLVASVSMGAAPRRYEEARSYGGWLQPGSAVARRLFIPLDIATGRLSYALSRTRKTRARERVSIAKRAAAPTPPRHRLGPPPVGDPSQ
jgi:N-carbamoylputrescine amidase